MTIYDAKSGKRQPEKTTRNKLMEAIHELQHDSKGKLSFWRQLPDDLPITAETQVNAERRLRSAYSESIMVTIISVKESYESYLNKR